MGQAEIVAYVVSTPYFNSLVAKKSLREKKKA